MCQRRLDTGKDSFNGANAALANTRLVVGTTSTGPNLTITGSVLTNDTDVDTPTGLTAGPATISSANCAGCNNVTMEADGNFTYDPPAGFTGNDTFTYTVNDNDPEAPANQPDTATVTIQVVGPLVWYVDIDATAPPAGQGGRSHSPFNSLAPLTTGGTADALDGAGDIIFLDNDDATVTGYSGGIVMETNQRLWGEPFGLTVDPGGPGAGTPPSTTLVAATGTTNPNVFNSAVGGVGITLANGVDIQRVNAGVTGTASTTGIQGTGVTTATIGANTLIQGNTTGFSLSGAAGGNIGVAATINGNTGTVANVANRTSGTVTFSGNLTGSLANSAITLTSNTGANIAFTGAINLNSTGAAITAFSASGGGTITANNAANQVATFAGTGINLNGVAIGAANFTLNTVSSAASAVNGVLLTNVAGPGALTVNGGAITATTRALDIDDNSVNVTIGATLTTSGTSARSVEVTNRDGGTVDINGLVTENSLGINLSTNGTGLVRFDGGINASTGANPALVSAVSGNLAVTDPAGATANTLTTTTGTALNVSNTIIHADDLTFQSITAGTGTDSAGVGISLDTTGSLGGLHVTGTGTAASGGTIQHKTGANGSTTGGIGIYLNNTSDVQLNQMQLNHFQNFAIRANVVNGLALNSVVVSGLNRNDAGSDEASVFIEDATGTITLSDVNISGGFEDNLSVLYNNASGGGAATFNVTGSTFHDPQAAGQNSQAKLISTTAASSAFNVAFNFSGSMVENDANTTPGGGTENWSDGILVTFEGPFQHTLNVQGSTFHHLFQGLDIASNFSADVNYAFLNNTITFTEGVAAIALGNGSSSTAQSLVTGLIQGNTIGTSGVAQSGSRLGQGIVLDFRGQETAQMTVHTNTIRRVEVGGIDVLANTGDGDLHLQLTNNVIDQVEDNVGGGISDGIRVLTGSGSLHDICLDARNNDSFKIGDGAGDELQLRQSNTGVVFAIEGLTGSGTSAANVEAYLDGQNPLFNPADGGTRVRTVASVVNYTSVASCTTPATQ